jgi:hypothetical protein
MHNYPVIVLARQQCVTLASSEEIEHTLPTIYNANELSSMHPSDHASLLHYNHYSLALADKLLVLMEVIGNTLAAYTDPTDQTMGLVPTIL